jgi:hypothetical protein
MLRGPIYLGRGSAPISATIEKKTGRVASILINPEMFLAEIEAHSDRYIASLRDPSNTDLRKKFNAAWELKNLDTPGVLHPRALTTD